MQFDCFGGVSIAQIEGKASVFYANNILSKIISDFFLIEFSHCVIGLFFYVFNIELFKITIVLSIKLEMGEISRFLKLYFFWLPSFSCQ